GDIYPTKKQDLTPAGIRPLQPDFAGDSLQRLDRERNVVLQGPGQVLRSPGNVLPVYGARERLVLQPLDDRGDGQIRNPLRRADLDAGSNESDELVARVDSLLHR